MTKIDLKCTGANLSARVDGEITAGMRGIGVEISFDEAWQGLTPVLVVSCGETVRRMAVDASGHSSVPWECCISGEKLNVGLCGLNEDGTVKLPTVWASCGRVHPSPEDVQAEQGSAPPTPDLVEQITALAFNAQAAANAVTEAAQRGEFNGQPGVTPELSVGTVTTLPAGSAATASITGTAGKPILNLGIPAGEAGAKGEAESPQGGVAVVFGDSLFENPGVYSFADFLRGKGIYREVVNYAVSGCCFKQSEPQISLADILQRADVLADVERADEIWLHLGGNDTIARAATGGSLSVFSEAVSLCLSIIKAHNSDALIRFVNSLPTAPEAAERYMLNKGAYSKSLIVSICESTFALDTAILLSDLNIISTRKNVQNIVFATHGNDGTHPTEETAAAWFEAILTSEFKGTRTLDYFYTDGTDLASIHDRLVKTGKLSPNCTVCLYNEALGFAAVPLHALFDNAVGQVSVYEYGFTIQCRVTSTAIEINALPLNPAEKEWQLKGTITSGDRITVDLTGCTELIIFGTVTGTGISSLLSNGGGMFYNICQNGAVSMFAHWKDWFMGMECITAALASGTVRQYGGSYNGYSNSADKKVSSVNQLYFSVPAVVTECNLQIYAR